MGRATANGTAGESRVRPCFSVVAARPTPPPKRALTLRLFAPGRRLAPRRDYPVELPSVKKPGTGHLRDGGPTRGEGARPVRFRSPIQPARTTCAN